MSPGMLVFGSIPWSLRLGAQRIKCSSIYCRVGDCNPPRKTIGDGGTMDCTKAIKQASELSGFKSGSD
jgi:hypothetical protein